ncbi:hypothetical protein GCM10029992_39640 [Glycomyces albus]
MATTGTKPVYHRPMPWQIVVALVFIGLDVLAYALMAAGLGVVAGSAPERSGVPIVLMTPVALIALAFIALGVCIAARLNKARKLAVIVNVIFLMFAVWSLISSIAFGGLDVPALFGGAFSLAMLYLLASDRAKAYTYKGDDSLPGD